MAKTTAYTCDECHQPVSSLYGVLRVIITSETEPQTNDDLDLCGFNCLEKFAKRGGRNQPTS